MHGPSLDRFLLRFDNTTQASVDAALPDIDPLPTVATRQPHSRSPVIIPDNLRPAPANLPAPVTYTGYSVKDWKLLMQTTGCDQLSMYQSKKRKKRKGQKKVEETLAAVGVGVALERLRCHGKPERCDDIVDSDGHGVKVNAEDQRGHDDSTEWSCKVVGAVRDSFGQVEVALLWEQEGKQGKQTGWEKISMLTDAMPGTEMHSNSFGQGREGEAIIVEWQSQRRFVAELQSWNNEDDNFTIKYPKQHNSLELKTSKSDEHKQAFRLDTLETDWLADPEVGAASGKLYHTWWVSIQYANLPFIAKRLLVNMEPNHQWTRDRKYELSDHDDNEKSDESSADDDNGKSDEPSDDDHENLHRQPSGDRKATAKPKRGRKTTEDLVRHVAGHTRSAYKRNKSE
jgi:hypothetical protein